MARGQVKKAPVQANQTVFALDIGTRSIIGMVGVVEEGKVKILAIEKEEHTERAMIDGQIENIEKVSQLAGRVKSRLEERLEIRLTRVCVAAAGRALRTRRADFEMNLSGAQVIDDEVISRLEAGAISRAEEAFDAENEAAGDSRRFYLVGYTVCQYYLDQYTMSSLRDHRGRQVKVDLIATFLPSEVVESLYTTMNKIGLEVASITLEPIAAINAAIPENLRLLNLVMVDIGAGTSDIAACTGGSVTGYTMATVAGDEITEAIMKAYLVDFETAEKIKVQMNQGGDITFADILGFEQKLSQEEIFACIQGTSDVLCKEIAEKIVEVNGGAPSALFLAGGGSKLSRLREGLARALGMDEKRVAIAGNYFQASAFSEEYDLNNPEYATPLGIVVSSGLNMINDSFRVILNDRPAKLFRSGSFTALNLLMMNGYSFRDIMGHPGANLIVTVNGSRKVFYGVPSQPASLQINGKEGKLSEIIHAGDTISFVPAMPGAPAKACLGDIEGAASCQEIQLNGAYAFLETPLKNGDEILMRLPGAESEESREDSPVSAPEAEMKESYETLQEAEAPVVQRETPLLETAGSQRGYTSAMRIKTTAEAEKQEGRQTAVRAAAPEGRQTEERAAAPEGRRTEERAAAPEERRKEERAMPPEKRRTEERAAAPEERRTEERAEMQQERTTAAERARKRELLFHLNDSPLRVPQKEDGQPYYLMDMLQYSGIDLKNPKGTVKLTVNGLPGRFQQVLKEGDRISILEEQA
jgi:cell division protein FtsA